jgi:hypothetical protein
LLRRTFLRLAAAAIILPALEWTTGHTPRSWRDEFNRLCNLKRQQLWTALADGMEKAFWGPPATIETTFTIQMPERSRHGLILA